MSTDKEKIAVLKDAGFRYVFERAVYLNRQMKKVFSLEAVEDHDEAWLRKCIGEATDAGDWKIYFNGTPSDAVRRDLSAQLEV